MFLHRAARLSILLLFACGGVALAQAVDPRDGNYALNEDGSMPPYVVPVLRLVSSTHVEPTTGLVITDTGLVLVPMGFASEGDEVIVLDGGTDIVRHGRPAHLKDYFPTEGLQIISVPGLRRQPAPFATDSLEDGAGVELTAFPPAERIAQGDAPLHHPATLVVFGESSEPAVSGESPLPNVTGPLLDDCGNVVAYSLAHEVQSLSSHPGTRYKWRRTLLAVMAKLGVSPAPSACREPPPQVEPPDEAPGTMQQPTEPEAERAEPEAVAPEPEPEPEPADTEAASGPQPEMEIPPEDPLDLSELPPYEEQEPATGPRTEPEGPGWLWSLPAVLLIGAGFGLHVWRRRMARAEATATSTDAPASPAAEEEIETPPLQPDLQLQLSGHLADGTAVEIAAEASAQAINLVIGRGEADLQIHSNAVSRRHAKLNGTATALTITDLGSNNGTSVNGVPCLEGEIFYIDANDILVLGDARLTLRLHGLDGGET